MFDAVFLAAERHSKPRYGLALSVRTGFEGDAVIAEPSGGVSPESDTARGVVGEQDLDARGGRGRQNRPRNEVTTAELITLLADVGLPSGESVEPLLCDNTRARNGPAGD